MEWQKGIHWLTEWWIAFKEVFMKTATDAFYGAVKILAGAWDGMRALWVIKSGISNTRGVMASISSFSSRTLP